MFKFLFGGDTTASDEATVAGIIAGQHRAATRGQGTAAQVAAANTKASLLSEQIEENLQLVWENEQLKKRLRESLEDYWTAQQTMRSMYFYVRDNWQPPNDEARAFVEPDPQKGSPLWCATKEAWERQSQTPENQAAFDKWLEQRKAGKRSHSPSVSIVLTPPNQH